MEIVQINVPDMPDLKALLANVLDIPKVETSNIVTFIKANWLGVLMVLALVSGLVYVAFFTPKEETPKPNDTQSAKPFNESINYVQKIN